MKILKYVLLLLLAALEFVKGNMSITIDTRYCPKSQLGGSNEKFANRLKNYVENSPQPKGYCTFTDPEYPI